MTQKTPFYSHHINLGAKIVDYAGFSMPIYYDSINEEHNQVREKALDFLMFLIWVKL